MTGVPFLRCEAAKLLRQSRPGGIIPRWTAHRSAIEGRFQENPPGMRRFHANSPVLCAIKGVVGRGYRRHFPRSPSALKKP